MNPMSKARRNVDQYKARQEAVRRANRIVRQERRAEANRLAEGVVQPTKAELEAELSQYKVKYDTAVEAVRAARHG